MHACRLWRIRTLLAYLGTDSGTGLGRTNLGRPRRALESAAYADSDGDAQLDESAQFEAAAVRAGWLPSPPAFRGGLVGALPRARIVS
eukprot:COSAG01_NODE_5020_length_4540_cov_25.225400_5_plen_88_part_00